MAAPLLWAVVTSVRCCREAQAPSSPFTPEHVSFSTVSGIDCSEQALERAHCVSLPVSDPGVLGDRSYTQRAQVPVATLRAAVEPSVVCSGPASSSGTWWVCDSCFPGVAGLNVPLE